MAPHYSVRYTRRYDLKVRLFRPLSATWRQQCFGWATGMPAELADPRMSGLAEGREGALQLPYSAPDVDVHTARACKAVQVSVFTQHHAALFCSAASESWRACQHPGQHRHSGDGRIATKQHVC